MAVSPAPTYQDARIDGLDERVGKLEDRDQTKERDIHRAFIAITEVKTTVRFWGVVAAFVAPLVATAAAWAFLRLAGAELVVSKAVASTPAATATVAGGRHP